MCRGIPAESTGPFPTNRCSVLHGSKKPLSGGTLRSTGYSAQLPDGIPAPSAPGQAGGRRKGLRTQILANRKWLPNHLVGARLEHSVPGPASIAFLQAFDQTAGQSDFDIGVFSGKGHESFPGEGALQSLRGGQLPAHEGHGALLHRPCVVEVHDPARLLLANAPGTARCLPQGEEVVARLVEAKGRKVMPATLVKQIQSGFDEAWMTDHHV